ncbi:hypothetical protein [Spirosoma rhododendri]|uniref:Uncharacterized protein n=1 Tax=Spirosoma rhododendri TaxID=2728024 RepID=A0A7L5DGC7_9BACT|nr:hypothetical protein [Spirosoma rhododendri]QJD77209.1 hypothetical protein HH216_01310 [Spirosoma rhododendri]
MRSLSTLLILLVTISFTVAQTPDPAVEKEKFALLNNGATVGMVIKSVIKADTKRLSLTEQQVPKARQIITDATVKFNEGVKKLKASGMNQKKLRVLAVDVETGKLLAYKAILTPQQYSILLAQHKKMYPESKV